jgi:putative transposase
VTLTQALLLWPKDHYWAISVHVNRGRHSAYSLHYHIVFVTKYRRPILGSVHLKRLREVFAELAADAKAELAEFNGEADHVHLLLHATPNTPNIARLVNNLKAVSSRRLRSEFCDIAGAYTRSVVWSRSYFAGTCGGAPLSVIKEYIKNQGG